MTKYRVTAFVGENIVKQEVGLRDYATAVMLQVIWLRDGIVTITDGALKIVRPTKVSVSDIHP